MNSLSAISYVQRVKEIVAKTNGFDFEKDGWVLFARKVYDSAHRTSKAIHTRIEGFSSRERFIEALELFNPNIIHSSRYTLKNSTLVYAENYDNDI
jgi:hypothetical protein